MKNVLSPSYFRKPNRVQDQVARHPLTSFVILAYAISWISWLLMWLTDMGAVNGLGIIAGTGPALAAMIVSAILRPEPSGISAGKRWRLFGMTGICMLAVLALRRLWIAGGLTTVTGRVAANVAYPTIVAFLLDILAAAVVAFVFSGILSPRQGVYDLLHSLIPRVHSVRWYWFVIAVGLYPAIMVLGNAISAGVGLPMPAIRATGTWYWLALDVMLAFLFVLPGGGGLEEPGWRGFALPLLLKRYKPVLSSLILAVIWAFWHWPMFWFGYYGGGPFGVFFYIFGCFTLALLMTAIFNQTGGNLLIVMLLHTSINTTPTFIPATSLASGLWMLLLLSVGLWMWRSPQTFSSHYKQEVERIQP